MFVLIADVLNRLLGKAVENGLIKGVSINRLGVNLSHLQYASDTILFIPAKREVILNFEHILDYYGLISGLTINYEKSTIIPLNCVDSFVEEFRNNLGCMVLSLTTCYLGIPLGANPRKVETWAPVIEKIKKKLSGWKSKLLSRTRRLILIKPVINNLPLYYLGLFKMPRCVVLKIISLQSNFFWDAKKAGTMMPLMKWDVIQDQNIWQSLAWEIL